MAQMLLVALGGAAGACARFWFSGVVARRVGETFPWGTLAVNASGALAIGFLAALLLAPQGGGVAGGGGTPWLALAVGVLGSYTTVSSFSLQTLALLRSGEGGRAVLNVLATLVLCLGAAVAGLCGGARLFGG
jgi:CrcB protein